MAGEDAQPATEDDPTRPDPRSEAIGSRLQSDVQALAVNMERLQGEWKAYRSETESISDRFKRYVAERQVVSITLFVIMIGILISAAMGVATIIWAPSPQAPAPPSVVQQPTASAPSEPGVVADDDMTSGLQQHEDEGT